MAKWVYRFSEGNASMRPLLGGKGANLAEMTGLGMPIPQGFTVTTEEMCIRDRSKSMGDRLGISPFTMLVIIFTGLLVYGCLLYTSSSMVTESIFENRFKYVDELNRMGAKIKVEGNTAYIEGVEKFTSAQLSAPDLRAGAALVIAALAADGISQIDDIEYIQRGYEDFEGKLSRCV